VSKQEKRNRKRAFACGVIGVLLLGVSTATRPDVSDQPQRLDPAAWGDDHVGKPIPDYATGDECLFCHRVKVGPQWGANPHHLTIRDLDEASPALAALKKSPAKDLAEEIKFVMGNQRRQRFLKPSKAYGKLEMLSVEWTPPSGEKPGRLGPADRPHWDGTAFGKSCAGCHSTAVNSKEQAFSAVSLDCYVCHGNVAPEHAKDPEQARLSLRRKESVRVVTSICAQCHIRTGKSRSSGLPYPNNFVAGDNLFRDFAVGFSDQELGTLSTADRHILENVRDVVLFGNESVTCLSCHDIHGRSSKKHRLVPESDSCLCCHQADIRALKPWTAHSKTCGY
jgi:Cytochrome c3